MKKGFILGLTTGVILTGASLVLANSQIQAILNDQIKVTLNNLRKVRNEGEHRCQVIMERRDESDNLYHFLQTATFNSVRTTLLKVVTAIEAIMGDRIVEGYIKTMLPSSCFISYNGKTEQLSPKLFSKIKNLSVNDKIKITISANKVIDVNY